MKTQYSLRVVAMAGVCLAPLAAAAQTFDLGGAAAGSDQPKEYSNEIDIGARYQSSNSPLFGRYTGNDAKGFSSLGGIHLQGNLDVGSIQPLAYEVTGTDLNFGPDHHGPNNALAPESEVNASIGQQGTWKVNGYYDAITYTGNTFYTPYYSSGAVAGPLAAKTSYTAAQLSAGELQTTAGTRRDISGGDAKYIIGDWTITSGLRHEHKEGILIQTAYSLAPFPEPVNYDTDRYNVQGQYATRRVQAILGYDYSKFSDNNTAFYAPFIGTSTSIGQYTLPANNDAHYVTARLGYNITPTTRLATNFRYGMEMSKVGLTSGYGASSTIPAAYAADYAGNPSGVGLLARTYNGNVTLTSRPIAKLDLKASYGLDGRDNSGNPFSFWGQPHADSTTSAPTYYTIRQQNWTKQKAALEAGYHILPSTKLTLGYQFDGISRSPGDAINAASNADQVGYWVGHSDENTLSAKLSNNSIRDVNASIAYEHGVRTGKFEYLSGEPENGSFYQAPRTADRIKIRADYSPNEEWTVGANGKYEANAYHYPQAEGYSWTVPATSRDYNASIGPDITYSPTKVLSTHLFYNYEQIYYLNRGQGSNAYLYNGGYGYSAATTDSVQTIGLSGDWQASERLKLGAEYTFSYGNVSYYMFDGITVATASNSAQLQSNLSLPSINSSMHSIKIHGEYKLTDDISLLAGYGFDYYKDNDWAYTYAAVLNSSTYTSGESENHYRVHSVYTAMRLKF